MSEHPPRTSKNHEKESPDETTEVVRDSQFRKDQIDANHINEHSGGKGVSPETVKEYYRRLEMSPEELSALKENSEKDDSATDLGQEGSSEETKEKAVVEARDAVDEAIRKDDEAAPDNSGDKTLEMEDAAEIALSPEEARQYEAVAARRNDVLRQIDEADKITNKKQRLEALETIAERHMKESDREADDTSWLTFPDLAIQAAKIMKDSKHHKGVKKWLLGRTKKFGETNSLQNDLLVRISDNNPDSVIGVEAAKEISMPWLRQETLLKRGQHALGKLQPLQESVAFDRDNPSEFEENLSDLNTYTHIAEMAKSDIKGWHSWKYKPDFKISMAANSMGPAYLDTISNFRFNKKQKALYDISVNERNTDIAGTIAYPWLRKKALNEIRRLNSAGS